MPPSASTGSISASPRINARRASLARMNANTSSPPSLQSSDAGRLNVASSSACSHTCSADPVVLALVEMQHDLPRRRVQLRQPVVDPLRQLPLERRVAGVLRQLRRRRGEPFEEQLDRRARAPRRGRQPHVRRAQPRTRDVVDRVRIEIVHRGVRVAVERRRAHLGERRCDLLELLARSARRASPPRTRTSCARRTRAADARDPPSPRLARARAPRTSRAPCRRARAPAGGDSASRISSPTLARRADDRAADALDIGHRGHPHVQVPGRQLALRRCGSGRRRSRPAARAPRGSAGRELAQLRRGSGEDMNLSD